MPSIYEDFNETDYEPTDFSDELFLSNAPINLIQKSIESQFQDPFEYRKRDYIQSFLIKYHFSKENLYEEELEEVEEIYDKFMEFMKDIFQSYLSIGFPELDDMGEDGELLILQTYRFFITNIKKNFINLIMSYIREHKEDLLDEEIAPKRKDVTTMNFKSEIENEEDVIILSNLSSIIHYILSQDITVDEFFELIESNNCLETEYVKEKFDEWLITGNFVRKYIDMINDDFYIELESKIRNKILKKYGKRKKSND